MYLPIITLKQPIEPKKAEKLPKSKPLVRIDMAELLGTKLRPVSPDSLPTYLGGCHESYKTAEPNLKLELLSKATVFQSKLAERENFRRMHSSQKGLNLGIELKRLFKTKGYDEHCFRPPHESPMRPKYILDEIINSHYGWSDLQRELRGVKRNFLNPIEVEDFYVIRDSKLPA